MSGPYKTLYRFEYGDPETPHAFEVRDYEDEPGYTVMRNEPNGIGRSLAWVAGIDDARDFLLALIGGVIRRDKAADEADRRDGRAE